MHHRITVLVGSFAALALAACASTPAPRPTEARAETRVTGSVSYRERIALTPDAVLHVEVVESAPQAGTPSVVGEQTLQNPGQVPIAFSVPVPSERIRPDSTYTVRARLTDAGRVFTTPQPVPVLTQGHLSQDVQVLVRSGG